ncbi:N-acetylmuramoyl-L-alanine amidase [Tianweitania sp. BSSL-BM11]|uniref:N-acetylmuramoyl-L-alanine amidase n=1 Tax=Tianweitania aestuarii TaxID=2814886 RepID=A0ABS5RX96_9HYPH|nr:N-acetylmuramoyl-L-alanine amidase [Tianweitania aestuarii]
MSAFRADFAAATVRPSPNFGERRGCDRPSFIILHYTGMITGQAAEDWLCAPESEVSSHYLVHEDGCVVQMVREADRAWHAGRSVWGGNADINSHSVGIEIVNPGHFLGYRPFPDCQIRSVIALCRDIATRSVIAPERVLAHSDVAPGRKIDPGELFPWAVLHAAGIGHFVQPEPLADDCPLALGSSSPQVAEVQQMLADYGYGLAVSGVLDETTRIVVEAFQRHFRPVRVDGLIDHSTRSTIKQLLRGCTSTARA